MAPSDPDEIRFFCDAMLGGLARWLRAAGYDAAFACGIDDGDLVDRCRRQSRMLLSSDGPLFERSVIRDGEVAALYVPQQRSKLEQLQFVVQELALPRLAPRCMACGGALQEVPKHTVTGEVPPVAFRRCDRYWRCERCGKLLWRGTHWQHITHKLDEIAGGDKRRAGHAR